jgi:hypothetical protein
VRNYISGSDSVYNVFNEYRFYTCELYLCVRTIDETEKDDDMNERYSKQRRVEKTEEQHFFASDRK